MAQIQTASKKPPMKATFNFSLGFASESEPKVETPDLLLNRQALQRIATAISLITQAIGFSVFGILIIVRQNQADLNGSLGGSSLAAVGGISAALVGTAFLVAACLYGTFYIRRSGALPVRRQSARFNFAKREPAIAVAVMS